jgi:hypothetical protein
VRAIPSVSRQRQLRIPRIAGGAVGNLRSTGFSTAAGGGSGVHQRSAGQSDDGNYGMAGGAASAEGGGCSGGDAGSALARRSATMRQGAGAGGGGSTDGAVVARVQIQRRGVGSGGGGRGSLCRSSSMRHPPCNRCRPMTG